MMDSEYLIDMPTFSKSRGDLILERDERFAVILKEWANFLISQHEKGFVSLFLTGSGVSASVVPNLSDIIQELGDIYFTNIKKGYRNINKDINNLFEALLEHKIKDRSIYARLLNSFQEDRESREKEWKSLNNWLFGKILYAKPTVFHKNLADLFEKIDVICLTLNFDGLLIRELVQYRNKPKSFSLPTKAECETFFLRNNTEESNYYSNSEKECLEIQIRGDILYVTCNSVSYCPQKDREHPLWTSIASFPKLGDMHNAIPKDIIMNFLKCPSCGEERFSYLSFPGAYKKEKDMVDILKTIWKYCAFRIGSVTVAGTSGEWDPLIVAFLGDLLSERDIPILVIEKPQNQIPYKDKVKPTYIINELILPKMHCGLVLGTDADRFSTTLMEHFSRAKKNQIIGNDTTINWDEGVTEDSYWHEKAVNSQVGTKIGISLETKYSKLENEIRKYLEQESLQEFAQLGLKSYWLGIHPDGIAQRDPRYHNRFNHSIGVMKIATFIYDTALRNSENKRNPSERQFIRLAALLHDSGHLPFSHLIENVFKELNWKPAGYSKSYSHMLQTDEKIRELLEHSSLKKDLLTSGYCGRDLINLINGRFGVPYLDAIINSPLDADKIDYVFRDTDSTGRKIALSPIQFLKDICSGISISPEKYLVLSKTASKASAELLLARKYLYESLYLQPSIIILEGIVKLILKTYFVHYLRLNDEKVLKKTKNIKRDCPDLGDYKIHFCVAELQRLLQKSKETDEGMKNLELGIIKIMYDEIIKIKDRLSRKFFDNITEGFQTIISTDNPDKLKDLELKIEIRQGKTNLEAIQELGRDVTFRIPGIAIVEARAFPNFLSVSESRKKRERSDSTEACAECILVPSGSYKLWNSASEANKALQDSSLNIQENKDIYVYLYPLVGDNDSSFRQALNLFDKLSRKKNITLQT